MLRWRLLLGALLIATLVGLCRLDTQLTRPGLVLFPLALIFAGFAAQEYTLLCQFRQSPASLVFVVAASLTVVASNWLTIIWPVNVLGPWGPAAIAFALVVVAALSLEVFAYDPHAKCSERLANHLLGAAYVGVLFTAVIQLRLLALPGFQNTGMAALACLIAVVKMGDTGAYTVGRLIGRTKMAPKLSPGKTLEGAGGGLLFAVLGAWAALAVSHALDGLPAIPSAWRIVLFGVVVGAAGMIGDLAESLLKRDAGRKDSSDWMPGFGGILDVVDSILFSAPVAYLAWIWIILGGLANASVVPGGV